MTKAELIEAVAGITVTTRAQAEIAVEAVFSSLTHALRNDIRVEIRGFGSFRVRERKARIGRNPKTGARVEVPAKKIPYFKPSKELLAGVVASA